MIPSNIADLLAIDVADVSHNIQASIQKYIFSKLRRKGAVVGLSGGIDSSVCAALCMRALGRERVLGLLMPEADSSEESVRLGNLVASSLGIQSVLEDVTPLLVGARCYQRRDDAIRSVVPRYSTGWKCKLVLPNVFDSDSLSIFSIIVQAPDGTVERHRLARDAFLSIVAATNFKQRTRKMIEYYYADKFHYSVIGTPNRLEYDQGFFVKNGDGAADLKPIAHLYKAQVYQLADYLGIPQEVTKRSPTTDTYPMEQSQEEFYFSVPLFTLDACLFGLNNGISPEALATRLDITADQVERVYRMIERRRAATSWQHWKPLLVAPVDLRRLPGVHATRYSRSVPS